MTDQPKRVGDYEILNELGSGGMGRVYRVRNVISDRIEAMKVLLPDVAGNQDLAARFLREIKLLASLNHPNIAALRTALTADNQLVMIMEYVEGTTLATRLETGPIPSKDALNYVDQVLAALSYAHQQHIVHRDIKPANIMLTPQGVIKVMDFGIARSGDDRGLTMTGTTLGSFGYMSPEQVKGEPTDARSDLYSVGISLYEMVTGQRPFQSNSDYSIMAAQVKDMPKPPIELQPGLPQALNEIIMIAIAKDPERRFQTADAFRNALSNIRGTAPVPQPAVTRQATVVIPTAGAGPHDSPTATFAKVSTPVATPPAARASNTPSIPIPPPTPASHRGLYITLGAAIVLVVLVVAGIYMPRHSQTQAGPSAAATSTPNASGDTFPATPTPTASDSATPSTPAPEPATPAPAVPQPESQSAKLPTHPQPSANQAAAAAAAAQAAAENARELEQLETQVDQLSARAAAVNSGLNRLEQQQSAQGLGLRGDMVERQETMNLNLSKAQSALQHHDAPSVKKYLGMAETNAEALEKFLGR